MTFWDLIRMSCGNLWRRKLRTFLTVLGVMIGTASIVVMVSLGLALNKSTMEEMENSGGLTTIEVYENSGFVDEVESGDEEKVAKKIDDAAIEQISRIPHVTVVSPVLNLQVIAKQGAYIGYLDVYGMTREGLEAKKMNLAWGQLPGEGDDLQFVYGNQVISNFYNEKSGEGYWDTGELPDIDYNKPIYYILDSDNYWESEEDDYGAGLSEEDVEGTEGGGTEQEVVQTVTKPKKYTFSIAGVTEGDLNTYTDDSYSVYCDLEALTSQLRQTFKNTVIPGQPTTKSGKPYKEIYYTQAYVKIDDMSNADSVQSQIKELGYTPSWNAEWVESQQKQYQSIQLILGGIGAVSLFVAAIGIANTMMMSIYERTKEIGILKVLGCSLSNIRSMFLLEASLIGFLGGLVGLILSFTISIVLNHFGAVYGESLTGVAGADISYIPLWLAGLSMVFAVLVGMIAGFFPALRAMRLSPLAAIRNE